MNKKLIKTHSVERKKKEKEKENIKDDTSNLIWKMTNRNFPKTSLNEFIN